MKKLIVTLLLLLPIFLTAQNKDWQELQGLIDSARTSPTGIVTVARNYTIDRPLIVHNWDGVRYNQVSIVIQGYATMWDRGQRSVIRTTFNDAPILSIQTAKGVLVKGLNLQGPSIGRDSRYSPQAGICIDPFSGSLPPDSGYPSLREWYRGPQTRSGSTGVRIEDCTINNTTVGLITSPNGYTQNAEIITYENIRLQAVKYGVVGCQSQEKQNRVINIGAWGPTNCVFVFNRYGAGQPGNWTIDGVNIAGSVDSLISRISSGWGPLFMTNVFAESIKTIGFWYAGSGDVFSRSIINLKYPAETGYYAESGIDGRYLIMQDVNVRYYGQTKTPIILNRVASVTGGEFYLPPIRGTYSHEPALPYKIDLVLGYTGYDTVVNNEVKIKIKYPTTHPVYVGEFAIFQGADNSYKGMGEIYKIQNDSAFIRYISPSVKTFNKVGVYRKL